MKLESYQLFATLCEGLVFEASTSLSLVKGIPGGNEVVKYLHTNKALAHNQEYKPINKISWSELKGTYGGAWVIIQGDNGVGAIKAGGYGYNAIASTGGEVDTFNNDRGGNILDFLKGKVGHLRKFYVGSDSGYAKKTNRDRTASKLAPQATATSTETLVYKFRPLWAKGLTAAAADIKGMAASMIKNDAFEKARRKIELLEKIEQGLMEIEAGNSNPPEFVTSAVKTAVYMAASHYYPEQTGNISKGYRGYMVDNDAGPRQLLKDISQGDQKKLSTVLAFFKRSLISG